MIKAVVSGAGGRMGGRIIALIMETSDIELVGAFEAKGHPSVGRDVGEVIGHGKIGIKVLDGLDRIIENADVIVDFTNHDASITHLRMAVESQKAIVIGSTGFSDAEMRIINEIAPKTRCVISPNMSVGVNVLFRMIKDVARILGNEYDVEIFELHHRTKKDAPSGTALRMAETIARILNRDLGSTGVYGRKGLVGERKWYEIGIHALRGGDVVGDHTIFFIGQGERLEITHRTHSRDNFARGALRAVRWIVNQPNGLYDMEDVLGLR